MIEGRNYFAMALVDDEDYNRLSQLGWRLSNGYAKCGQNYMHNLIMGRKPGLVVDHKNRNKLGNQRSNLRHCTKGEDLSNRRRWGTSLSSYYRHQKEREHGS